MDGRRDRQTDRVKPIPPTTSLCRGYNNKDKNGLPITTQKRNMQWSMFESLFLKAEENWFAEILVMGKHMLLEVTISRKTLATKMADEGTQALVNVLVMAFQIVWSGKRQSTFQAGYPCLKQNRQVLRELPPGDRFKMLWTGFIQYVKNVSAWDQMKHVYFDTVRQVINWT